MQRCQGYVNVMNEILEGRSPQGGRGACSPGKFWKKDPIGPIWWVFEVNMMFSWLQRVRFENLCVWVWDWLVMRVTSAQCVRLGRSAYDDLVLRPHYRNILNLLLIRQKYSWKKQYQTVVRNRKIYQIKRIDIRSLSLSFNNIDHISDW